MPTQSDAPLVSVILRTYERPQFLKRAIDSVLDQTYEHYELIIIDDHSQDETPEIVRSYEDDRIVFIRNEVNEGHVTTLNIATKQASGDYIAFLDDDDVWLPEKLEAQVERMEQLDDEYGLVYGVFRHRAVETDEVIREFRAGLEGDIYEEVLKAGSGSVFGPPSCVMVRPAVFEDMGYFDEDRRRGAGQKFFRELAKKYKIAYVDTPCVDHYVHDERITSISTEDELEEAIRVHEDKLENLGEDLKQVPVAFSREAGRLGDLYFQNGERDKAREMYLKAIRHRINAKLVAKLILSYFHPSFYHTIKTVYRRFRYR